MNCKIMIICVFFILTGTAFLSGCQEIDKETKHLSHTGLLYEVRAGDPPHLHTFLFFTDGHYVDVNEDSVAGYALCKPFEGKNTIVFYDSGYNEYGNFWSIRIISVEEVN